MIDTITNLKNDLSEIEDNIKLYPVKGQDLMNLESSLRVAQTAIDRAMEIASV
tara:strand:+ start:1821 stop:1979 length:159 start_codon:yes stop_codon:yes gene_type:complete